MDKMRMMWKQRMGQRAVRCSALLSLLAVFLILSACGRQESGEETLIMRAENAKAVSGEAPALALVLASRDGAENEELIESFRETAKEQGAELLVRLPDVSEEEAREARELAGSFVLCEVDPIEYQMLLLNELVAEEADVIAIHPNHSEALEPVLAAARAVGIRICAFGQEVGEESCDIYTTAGEAPQAAAGLLQAEE